MSCRRHLPPDQSERNAQNALRVMATLPHVNFGPVADLIQSGRYADALGALKWVQAPQVDPSKELDPMIIVRAEIVNALRYATC